jgi:hypothetical protein
MALELWGHWGAPNPWKVATILETLNLPYTIHSVELNEVKKDSYLAMTPNGRLPTLRDPNTGLVLWEVGSFSTSLVYVNFKLTDCSPAPSFSTWWSNTTPTKRSRTVASQKNGMRSSGYHSRFQVRRWPRICPELP